MEPFLLVVLIGLPLGWHLAMTGYAYWDAGRNDMSQRKWGTVALMVPFFGFFAYIFERDERNRDPEPDMFAEGPFKVHESRADEAPLAPGGERDERPGRRGQGPDDGERDADSDSEPR